LAIPGVIDTPAALRVGSSASHLTLGALARKGLKVRIACTAR
jgi:hypothetical protein